MKTEYRKHCSKGLLLLVGILALLSVQVSAVEARSLEIVEVDINAEVLANGDIKVTESRTVAFYGQFRGADYKIYFNNIELFSEINVREGDFYYTLVDEFPTTEPGTYALQVYGEDYFVIDWSFSAIDERRTFTFDYIIRDAIVVHNDTAELYYKFIGDEWEFPTSDARVTLTLPEGAAEEELRAWGHGPTHGEVKIDGPRQVTWWVAPLSAYTFLEGRVLFPKELVPESTRFSGRDALSVILKEEERLARQANLGRVARKYQLYFSLFLLLPVGFSIVSKRRRAANLAHAYKGEYYRELPGQYPPEVAGYLWNKKQIQNEYLSAGILDLARRRHLRIDEVNLSGEGSKAGEKDYRLVEINGEGPLSSLDSLVLDFLFVTVHVEVAKDEQNDSEKAVTFTQLQSFAKSKSSNFRSFHQAWTKAVKQAGEGQRFFKDNPAWGLGCLPQFLIFITGFVAIFWWQLYILAVVLLVAPIFMFFASPSISYSDYGADQLSKWKAFRRFLLHFSEMERSTVPSLVIWEHYLVYAVALGVARQVIDQLAIVFPNLEKEPTFNQTSWSSFNATQSLAAIQSMNSLTRSLNSTINTATRTSTAVITAASSSSSSRSSGGFSSGSGGGGGFSSGGGGGFGGGGGSFR
ncbi:MAG: DUF2207 domain-containing protein [Dethiobacteria bacterium]|nr:DUF2207 domain-containing protein [Dethiobacteria bacterium]